MFRLKHHSLSRWVFVLIVLQIANLSVNLPDRLIYTRLYSIFECENTNVNEMESLMEVIAEGVLEIPNAFPEHDEPDEDSDHSKALLLFYIDMFPMERINLLELELIPPDVVTYEFLTLPSLSPPPEIFD